MIIKSMSRKGPTFGQLADYIARGSNAQTGTKSPNQTFVHSAANSHSEPNFPKLGSAANVGSREWRHHEYLS